MNIKTKIKNDMWKINYILPFVKKHQFDERGKVDVIRHVLNAYKNIKPIKGRGKRTVGNDIKALLKAITISFDSSSKFIYFLDTKKTIAVPGNILSNFTIAYDKIIHGTFQQLVDKAMGDDEYGREAMFVYEGIKILAQRICDALNVSKLDDALKEKHIAYFNRMLSTEAEHFDEGLQRILFFNQIMWQTRHRLNGLGRLDKILDDLYSKDIKKSYINENDAHELIHDFLNQLSKYPEYKSDALEGDIGQIIILGGLNPDESYFCNNLTEIFLEEQAKLKKPDPKTLLCVSSKMPDDLLKLAIDCLSAKTGSPLFSNDDVVIPALIQFGMSKDEAFTYCTSACWEPFIVGKSLDQNNIAVFDYFTALDEVLAEESNSFDELVDKYIEKNKTRFVEFLNGLNMMKWAKDPLISIFTDGCNEKRKDISEGACEHKDYGITTVAISNVVDSLLNIKKLVYENKKYSLKELNDARLKNFEGQDEMYKIIQEMSKFYGHDDKETIDLVNKMTDSLTSVATRYKNFYGGTVKFGLSSPGYNILSKKANADLSGKKSGMPYNTHISCLDASYTEVVNFASHLDYKKQRFNGNVVDFFVAPGFLKENADKFYLFMKNSIKCGFFQMQLNVMDSMTLIDAKAHPEKYAGLVVRVWGFSAYFNDLPESYKDLLIERAIAAEKNA